MSAPGSPPWTHGSGSRRRAGYTPHLRVSDADRAQAADRLSRHYADGRLDEPTFNERLDQAMQAKTQSELTALFTDLPETGAPEAAEHSSGGRARRHRVLFLLFVIVIAAAVGHALAESFVPWLLFGVLALVWLRFGPWQRRRL
jgi:Flp pilus assembly protein TadB